MDRSRSRSREQATEEAKKRPRRGKRSIPNLIESLPDWAREVANQANRSPLTEMRATLKSTDRLQQTLRRLIEEKEKVKMAGIKKEEVQREETPAASSASGSRAEPVISYK